MGKGDRGTRRGKICAGSYGKSRRGGRHGAALTAVLGQKPPAAPGARRAATRKAEPAAAPAPAAE